MHPACRYLPIAIFFSAAIFPLYSQTIDDRINAILSTMSMDEKILQLHQQGGFNTADNTRLHIPGFVMSDGPHGVRDGMATSWPVSIAMAASWDPDLAQRVGTAMGEEFRGKGKHQALGPSMDLDRDPRDGRSPETGGEDPFLCARITSAVIRGIQSTGCLATAKHYNGNARENGRTTNNVIVSERMLIEHYGLQFRSAVQQGGVFSVMNAYNLINGQKCAENPDLLTTILRAKWGFPFYVVSDWGSIWNSEQAIKAGCDICMGSDNYTNDLPSLVSSGSVASATIDSAVRRVLRTKILAGMLDHYAPGDPAAVNSPAHQQLCLEAGERSLVLLRNEGDLLPLDASTISSLALVGPSAALLQIDGTGSSYVTPFYTVTPKQGIETVLGASRVQYARGCDINSTDTSGFGAAASIASAAEVVVYCGGLDPTQEGEGADRATGSIDLPGRQQDLINRLAAVNPRIVVVLFSGGICGINRCVDNIPALLYAFYPGQEGGNAVAQTLFGLYNPGGKLPVTYPKTDAQLPEWNDNFNDDFGCGYRWFDARGLTPQFAFGFGLSYTTFAYGNLSITPSSAPLGSPVTVNFDVTNTGTRRGDEVAQLYITHTSGVILVPVKELKAFKRITLNPGERASLTFQLTPEELYYYSESTGEFEVEPSTYTVRIGGASDNLPLSGSFVLSDGPRKCDLQISGVRSVPAFPAQGDSVLFLATILNEGTSPSPAGITHKVSFRVSGLPVSTSTEFSGPIPTGGMALVCARGGPDAYIASQAGTYQVEACVDPDNMIDELAEDNNTLSVPMRVNPPAPINIALNKPVTVSSVESAGLEGENAVDGNPTSRWSSAFSDPQYIAIDLGAEYQINRVLLRWETAFARTYMIQVADSGGAWVPVFYTSSGDGGNDTIALAVTGRLIKLTGITRATSWGYSLYEFEVYGSPLARVDSPIGIPLRYALHENYPNPFNPSTVISYDLPRASEVSLRIYDLLGREVATLVHGMVPAGAHHISWRAAGLASGVYFCRFAAGSYAEVKKLVLQK